MRWLRCVAKLRFNPGLCGKQASHVHVNDPGYQPWQQPHPRALIPACYHHAHEYGNAILLSKLYDLLDASAAQEGERQ